MKRNITEITWIFGSSAAGKETFINYVVKEYPTNLINFLGWQGKELVPCEESISYIAQFIDDPVGQKREELVEIIPKLAKEENKVILVKGQDLDLEASRPQKILDLTPDCVHRIIFLHTSMENLFKRVEHKPWWKEEYKDEFMEWLEYQIDLIQKLPDNFEIIALDSSNVGSYTVIDFPPKF